jgi:hypothetical protein
VPESQQSFLSYRVYPPEVGFGCEYSTGRTPKLPKSKQQRPEWQAAVEAMLLVVDHNGPTMMARIGVMRALNRHVVREFNPDCKDTHWGKRKLKRDE